MHTFPRSRVEPARLSDPHPESPTRSLSLLRHLLLPPTLVVGFGLLLLQQAAASPPTAAAFILQGPEAPVTSRFQSPVGFKGMVVSDSPEASAWGMEILRAGGNAVDAAVATALMLAVTRPHYASLGGGGFLVFCPSPTDLNLQKKVNQLLALTPPAARSSSTDNVNTDTKTDTPTLPPTLPPDCISLDYREIAPALIESQFFIPTQRILSSLTATGGSALNSASQKGALASATPGTPAGLLTALGALGSFKAARLLARPIEVAEKGFRLTPHGERAAQERWLDFNPAAQTLLGCKSPSPATLQNPHPKLTACPTGTLIHQPELAAILRKLAQQGKRGFYEGSVAQKIAQGIQKAGGVMSTADLKSYAPTWRRPLQGQFQDWSVQSMALPSSGGTVLLQLLFYAEAAIRDQRLKEGFGAAQSIHALSHAMSLGFADRAYFLGDPDFLENPLLTLLTPPYLQKRWASFDSLKSTPPQDRGNPQDLGLSSQASNRGSEPGLNPAPSSPANLQRPRQPAEGQHTTHLSVIDASGNAVALTTSINHNYGSGFVPPGTGVMMNNEIDDFSLQPGAANGFGLMGSAANALAPRKRPLSSMTPTIIRDAQGHVKVVIGAAGGPRIISAVFLSLINHLYFQMPLSDAIAAPRFHHQWQPDLLLLERYGFPQEVKEGLARLGYLFQEVTQLASIHAIEQQPHHRAVGYADPRGEGSAIGY